MKSFVFALLICSFPVLANFEIRKEFPISEVSIKKVEGAKYVDVVMATYRGSGLKWRDLKKTFLDSRKHYKAAGINLNLIKAVEVKMRSKYRSHLANNIDGVDPRQGVQPYEGMRIRKSSLHNRAKRVFEKLSYLAPQPENTIFVVISKGIFYKAFFNRPQGRITLNQGVKGFSFPAYIFEDRIPRELRGFTSMLPEAGGRTMSHELGHKLINVSHEGLSACPRFSGDKVPGLMGYNSSTTIHSGRSGRFHKERLHLSPFVYMIKNGQRVQNRDYEEHGHYRDPIYQGKFFLTPECP